MFGSVMLEGRYASTFSAPEAASLNTPLPVKVRLYGRPERATKVALSPVLRSEKNSSRNDICIEILCLLL